MLCSEKGTLPGSEYFFFNAIPLIKKYYLFITVLGHFHCNKHYRITRSGGHDPLLIYIHSGELCLETNSVRYRASAGEFLLIDCMIPHTYFCPSKCEIYFFHFAGAHATEMVRLLISQYRGCHIISPDSETIAALMKSLYCDLSATENGQSNATTVSTGYLSRTAYSALSYLQDFNLPVSVSEADFARPISDLVGLTVHEIRKCLEQPIHLQQLADAVNVSPSHLSHVFKKETGCTPIAYASTLKIDLAKTLLLTTGKSIADIAVSLGYASSSSFINAFRAQLGCSPLTYRNLSKSDV